MMPGSIKLYKFDFLYLQRELQVQLALNLVLGFLIWQQQASSIKAENQRVARILFSILYPTWTKHAAPQ